MPEVIQRDIKVTNLQVDIQFGCRRSISATSRGGAGVHIRGPHFQAQDVEHYPEQKSFL